MPEAIPSLAPGDTVMRDLGNGSVGLAARRGGGGRSFSPPRGSVGSYSRSRPGRRSYDQPQGGNFRGSGRHSLPALYGRFDRLLRTTLALIEDGDPTLSPKLKRSRAKLWHIPIDREEFYAAMDESDVALLEGFARH